MSRPSDGTSSITRCPQCGSRNLTWSGPKQFFCAACGFVLYLNIAAAVAAIIECRGEILFGVRRKEPKAGMLDLPGGFVDQNETAEEALRRELREELLVDMPGKLQYFCSFPNRYPYRGIVYDTLDLFFVMQLEDRPLIRAGDDLAGVRWIGRTAVDERLIGFDSVREAIRLYLQSASESGGVNLQNRP